MRKRRRGTLTDVLGTVLLVHAAACNSSAISIPIDAGTSDVALECPRESRNCNMVVGTVDGVGLEFKRLCVASGAITIWVTLIDDVHAGICDSPLIDVETHGHTALSISFSDLTREITDLRADWHPPGKLFAERERAEAGSLNLPLNRLAGTFDFSFHGERICGCFDKNPDDGNLDAAAVETLTGTIGGPSLTD